MKFLVNILVFLGIFYSFLTLTKGIPSSSSRSASKVGDVLDVSRRGLFLKGNDMVLDPWREWLEEASNDLPSNIRKALAAPSWWQSWSDLSSDIKEAVISRFLPILVSNNGWSLHCSDAYRLCLADNICSWRYWNFVTSCPSKHKPLIRLNEASELNSNLIGMSRSWKREVRSVSRKVRRRRRKRIRITKRRWSTNLIFIQKRRKRVKMATALKKASDYLHYWMGKYWPNIYEKRSGSDQDSCSSDCLKSLVMLNKTVYGTLLTHCSCKQVREGKNENKNSNKNWDVSVCKKHQATARLCRPRLYRPRRSKVGCTEARVRCQQNPSCHRAQRTFLLRCSQLISGVTCTAECIKAIGKLREESKYYNSCVCDGTEKPTCLKIRSYMSDFCWAEKECPPDQEVAQNGQVIIASKKNCATRNIDNFAISPLPEPRNAAFSAFGAVFFVNLVKIFTLSLYVTYFLI